MNCLPVSNHPAFICLQLNPFKIRLYLSGGEDDYGTDKEGLYPLTDAIPLTVFEKGIQAQQWKLTESVLSTTGVIIASYVPDGEVKFGSFGLDEVSEAELARRKKWSQELGVAGRSCMAPFYSLLCNELFQ